MHFIFNNLSSSGLPSMTVEFHESFSQEYLPWVAQYLVRRATIESNFHMIYLAFVDWLDLVLQEIYTQINAILLVTSLLNHFTGGSGLKNLGHWLSLQTLARDKCVSDTTELPVREILLEVAHKGHSSLLPVVIFVG